MKYTKLVNKSVQKKPETLEEAEKERLAPDLKVEDDEVEFSTAIGTARRRDDWL